MIAKDRVKSSTKLSQKTKGGDFCRVVSNDSFDKVSSRSVSEKEKLHSVAYAGFSKGGGGAE